MLTTMHKLTRFINDLLDDDKEYLDQLSYNEIRRFASLLLTNMSSSEQYDIIQEAINEDPAPIAAALLSLLDEPLNDSNRDRLLELLLENITNYINAQMEDAISDQLWARRDTQLNKIKRRMSEWREVDDRQRAEDMRKQLDQGTL